MRIAIDARELAGQPTGVGRYLSEILGEWERLPDASQHDFVFCAPVEVAYSGSLRAASNVEGGDGARWEQFVLPRLASAAQADVLFCPGYSGPIFDTLPLVLAVHDVSFAAHPEWFRWREGLRRRLLTRASARRAARVLTLTEFSKREIVDHLGVPPDRIEVVYPGVSTQPFENVAQPVRAASDDSLVLYVGSIFNRRHVPETIRAFERLARRRNGVRLAIVGDNRTFPRVDISRMVRDNDHIQIHSYVPDDVLGGLYRQARAFIFLSEYEGFGLTPLEALAAGVPIVVLDTPVAREVYGDAAQYVGAPDPRQVEQALDLVLYNDDLRSALLRAAPAVVGRYSWATCARRVLAALASAAR